MAAARVRIASLANELTYVDFGYDDVSQLVNRIYWANLQDVPVLAFVTHPDGSDFFRVTLPPQTPEQNLALVGTRRFNLETESPSVNLAS